MGEPINTGHYLCIEDCFTPPRHIVMGTIHYISHVRGDPTRGTGRYRIDDSKGMYIRRTIAENFHRLPDNYTDKDLLKAALQTGVKPV